ncbi:MAG TPA: XcyI family restriction endonuclease [Rhodospirillaceae bacterium]|nr:XcyI family restriction endonuclease [Rhodospirillaceae bacterium]
MPYGFSQRGFYTTETGVSRFQSMEKKGTLSAANEKLLPDLCHAIASAGAILLERSQRR